MPIQLTESLMRLTNPKGIMAWRHIKNATPEQIQTFMDNARERGLTVKDDITMAEWNAAPPKMKVVIDASALKPIEIED